MKLSISNLGWTAEQDQAVYELMKKYDFEGLEIAPTRIFPDAPYEKRNEAGYWAENLKRQHGFVVSSMQSIWFGRKEKLFGSYEERNSLIDYTKKAIDFAEAIGCKNLVFGCPGNRNMPEGADPNIAVKFFKEIGDYAAGHDTVVGMEANPPIYNTNYINDTLAALNLIEQVDSKGFLLNLDLGTMVQNEEPADELVGKVKYINHVHISEPGLKPIEPRPFHTELLKILKAEQYHGFVSIEMSKADELGVLKNCMDYVRRIISE